VLVVLVLVELEIVALIQFFQPLHPQVVAQEVLKVETGLLVALVVEVVTLAI
jgi:hypothetical protein